jgi:hypothetical protein
MGNCISTLRKRDIWDIWYSFYINYKNKEKNKIL